MKFDGRQMTIAECVENAFVAYASEKYPFDLERDPNWVGMIEARIMRRLGGVDEVGALAIRTLLQFVFSHNMRGASLHILPPDGFDAHAPQHWIRERIAFLALQPDLPMRMGSEGVDVTPSGKVFSDILPLIQRRLDAAYLHQAHAWFDAYRKQHRAKQYSTVFMATFFACFGFGFALAFIGFVACFDAWSRWKTNHIAKHAQYLELLSKEHFLGKIDLRQHQAIVFQAEA